MVKYGLSRHMLLSIDAYECVFIERRNRFVGLVSIDDSLVDVHITNTGRLSELLVRGRPCISYRIKGSRLSYRLAGIRVNGGYAVVDTILQSRAFEKALEDSMLPWLEGCSIASKNPRVGDSLLDYKLSCPWGNVYIELKSAVLIGPNREAMYPDCPTLRGQRHIRQLIAMTKAGLKAMLVMVAGFPNARCFKPYRQGDPLVYELIAEAYVSGVDVKALSISMDNSGDIWLENPDLPLCGEWIREAVK